MLFSGFLSSLFTFVLPVLIFFLYLSIFIEFCLGGMFLMGEEDFGGGVWVFTSFLGGLLL